MTHVDAEQGSTEPLTGGSGDAASPSKVTFVRKSSDGKTNDATIDISVAATGYTGQGLSKSEVMAYANDPTWKMIRMSSFVLFWLVWLGMLGAAVAIVATGTCVKKEAKQ